MGGTVQCSFGVKGTVLFGDSGFDSRSYPQKSGKPEPVLPCGSCRRTPTHEPLKPKPLNPNLDRIVAAGIGLPNWTSTDTASLQPRISPQISRRLGPKESKAPF